MGQLMALIFTYALSQGKPVFGETLAVQIYFLANFASAVLALVVLFTFYKHGLSAGLAGAGALLALPMVLIRQIPDSLWTITVPQVTVILLLIMCYAHGYLHRVDKKQ